MRAPPFWYQRAGVWAVLLSPLGVVYAAATRQRLARGQRQRMPVPVICVGNLTAGGTGKTPTVIALATRLAKRGWTPHAITRGHGGALAGPVRVLPDRHDAGQVGDEALLLAAFLPVWVAKNRATGAEAAVKQGANVLLLDDGFQNARLYYDLSIVVVDAARGFGNGRVIPAGPLREPIARGLSRADLILSIGPQKAQQKFAQVWAHVVQGRHLTGALHPLPMGMSLKEMPVLAFAGIGHPQRFFSTLVGMGANVCAAHALADHQPLTQPLMARMARQAHALGAQMVTTEKDAARLPPAWRGQVIAVPVRLELDDWAVIDKRLNAILT